MTGTPTTADAMAVTASMRWEAMWEQQPFNMTLAVGALPLGLFLASFGRRHHKTCSLVVVCAFGAWLGMLGGTRCETCCPIRLKFRITHT